MIRIAILIAASATSACAAISITSNDQPQWTAVVAAEAFVARHGYTAAGHPSGQPVVGAEIFDILSGSDTLVASRMNTLEPKPFGLRSVGDKDYYVLFRMVHDSEQCRVVLVEKGRAVQMLHDPVPIKSQRWQPIRHEAPPNNSFKPKPLRSGKNMAEKRAMFSPPLRVSA